MASHLQMKRGRLSWRPLFPYWSLLGPVFVPRWRDTSRTRRRPRPRRPPRRRAAAMRNRIPLNQKRLCVDLVHEDEWELDGTVRILTHKQPLRAGFAERTLATSSRTYGGCRPCHGSSKLRSRNAQPKPPPWGCWVPPDWVFRCWVTHQRPRCPLLISRNLTIFRPISASFLAKRKWPTSVSPRSISWIRKALAAACS